MKRPGNEPIRLVASSGTNKSNFWELILCLMTQVVKIWYTPIRIVQRRKVQDEKQYNYAKYNQE